MCGTSSDQWRSNWINSPPLKKRNLTNSNPFVRLLHIVDQLSSSFFPSFSVRHNISLLTSNCGKWWWNLNCYYSHENATLLEGLATFWPPWLDVSSFSFLMLCRSTIWCANFVPAGCASSNWAVISMFTSNCSFLSCFFGHEWSPTVFRHRYREFRLIFWSCAIKDSASISQVNKKLLEWEDYEWNIYSSSCSLTL